jgi:A/G-specific adenine glycosylase
VYEFIDGNVQRSTLNAQRSTLNSMLDVERPAFDVLQSLMSRKNIRVFHRSLLAWYRCYGRDLPWRRTRDPYTILVSEFMLQQTQVATVIPYYNAWLGRFPDFVSLARASENDVLRAWQGLGYYARARNLHAAARAVVNRHGGRFPRSVGQMQQLRGIGKYTAHAVASFAFDEAVPIVEANTARVLARILGFRRPIDSAAGQKALWQHAAALVPKRSVRIYNSALIDLGALVCVPRQPKCGICPVKKFCRAKNPQILPVRKCLPHKKRLIEQHAFVVRRGKILLEQSSTRWRGMWMLPRLQRRPNNQRPIYESVFPFTNHRVVMNVFARRPQKNDPPKDRFVVGNRPSKRWIRIRTLESVPIPSPHRKALQHLLNNIDTVA